MVNSLSVLAMQGLLFANRSALTFVNFDCSLNTNFDFNSHGQAVATYNKLNMSKDECAEPYCKGCRTWLN